MGLSWARALTGPDDGRTRRSSWDLIHFHFGDWVFLIAVSYSSIRAKSGGSRCRQLAPCQARWSTSCSSGRLRCAGGSWALTALPPYCWPCVGRFRGSRERSFRCSTASIDSAVALSVLFGNSCCSCFHFASSPGACSVECPSWGPPMRCKRCFAYSPSSFPCSCYSFETYPSSISKYCYPYGYYSFFSKCYFRNLISSGSDYCAFEQPCCRSSRCPGRQWTRCHFGRVFPRYIDCLHWHPISEIELPAAL